MPHAPNSRRPRRVDREQLKADVLRGLSVGLPLSVVARRNGTSQDWVSKRERADPAFAEEIAAARALGWDHLAAECLDIADDSRNDYVEQLKDSGESLGWRFDTENVLRSKLRIETRLRLLACWDTGRYGPQRTVKIEGDVQVTQRHVVDPRSLTDEQRAVLRALIEDHGDAEPVDAEFEDASDT